MPTVDEYKFKKDEDQGLPNNEKKVFENKTTNNAISASLNLMFYVILVSAILFVSISGMYSPEGVPRTILGYSIMRVATGSMRPELPINTLIVTQQVDPNELEIGEIVTFLQSDGTTITHRIYEIHEDFSGLGIRGFRLIGDANHGIPDHDIHQAGNLIGRVVASNYSLGQFLMFVHNRFITILIIIIVLLFALKMGMSFRDKKKKESILDGKEIRRAEA